MTASMPNAPRTTDRELALKVLHTVQSLSPGDLAALRKLTLDGARPPAFWRVIAADLDTVLPVDASIRSAIEDRWAVILAAMANAKGFHSPRVPLGRALADNVDERRVLQLLRARDAALGDAVRMVVHHLVSNGASFDQTGLARLVLSDGRDETERERVRREVYRDFFAATPIKFDD